MKHDPEFIAEAKATGNVYNLAADAIEFYGHAKLSLKDGQGRMCLLGAINYVVTGNAFGWHRESQRLLKDLRPLISPEGSVDPVIWNNDWERTQAEVVGLLRKAAKVLA